MTKPWLTAGLLLALAGGALWASPSAVLPGAPAAMPGGSVSGTIGPDPSGAATGIARGVGGALAAPAVDNRPVFPGAPLPPPEVDTAPVAMLYDVGSGQMLFGRAIDRHFLPASVTKVMTLYVAFDLMAKGKLSPDRLLTVSDGAWREWHAKGSRMFLERGSQVSVDALLTGIANVSANDGCVVLAEGVAGSVPGWTAMMNARAAELGMKDSHFNTPNGWMDEGQTYYSARDLTRLAQAMLTRFPAYYHRYIGHDTMTWNGITQKNHDPTLGLVPGADGIKTGFTNEAGYNFLGSATRGGRRLVMVVANVPTAKDRAKAARALIEWGYSAWDARRLYPAGAVLGEAEVQQGTVARVGLALPHDAWAAMPKGQAAPVKLNIRYTGPLTAPIVRGSEVARLEVRVGNQPAITLPLVANADVPRGNAWDRLRSGFSRVLR